ERSDPRRTGVWKLGVVAILRGSLCSHLRMRFVLVCSPPTRGRESASRAPKKLIPVPFPRPHTCPWSAKGEDAYELPAGRSGGVGGRPAPGRVRKAGLRSMATA